MAESVKNCRQPFTTHNTASSQVNGGEEESKGGATETLSVGGAANLIWKLLKLTNFNTQRYFPTFSGFLSGPNAL